MLIKMRQSKGFTLVELMIVVAIIGILAAVAVPFYQNYINKSRLTAYVFPGVHSIQTNVGNWYSFKNTFPAAAATLIQMMADADSQCFTVGMGAAGTSLIITIDAAAANSIRCQAMTKMDLQRLIMSPHITNGIIQSWEIMPTTLSTSLGLAGEGA